MTNLGHVEPKSSGPHPELPPPVGIWSQASAGFFDAAGDLQWLQGELDHAWAL